MNTPRLTHLKPSMLCDPWSPGATDDELAKLALFLVASQCDVTHFTCWVEAMLLPRETQTNNDSKAEDSSSEETDALEITATCETWLTLRSTLYMTCSRRCRTWRCSNFGSITSRSRPRS
ncbi:hypothetical protein BDV98DRAFT_571942 [Pterulicium gracile]|uniref:Uncharacterized protein n=1 Tax=Pterulicium gracile TaxID=1884261 RepID=A0A5C3QKL9_9AGAR|nr:hypothetical protein BDV98DRAFT_571942 [Pterula gracilis]